MWKTQVVNAEDADKRLDRYLSQLDPNNISRSQWKRLVEAGSVLLNGQPTKPKVILNLSDKIQIDWPTHDKTTIDMPIINETNDYIVINKPAGVLSHSKSKYDDEYTVSDFVAARTSSFGTTSERTGIVHRLDRLTSGVMIMAKTEPTLEYLSSQFAARSVEKYYIALVAGEVKKTALLIDAPIARGKKDPRKFVADTSGRPAQTVMNLIKYVPEANLSVLLLKPLTGRTHQLRVHLKLINHPILGDKLYGSKSKFNRTMLHAYQLSISTKSGRRSQTFSAKLPADMSSYINEDEIKSAITTFSD